MAVSHYTRYVQSMVAQGGQRMADINWLFASVDSSLRVAQKRLIAGERKRALVSLQHAKNLCGFLQKSLGDLPDPRLVKHLNEFFLYVDDSIDSSLRLPLDNDLSEMRTLISDLHRGWEHLISPMRGHAAATPRQVSEHS
jgi:flagellin-specific chaperone FliS